MDLSGGESIVADRHRAVSPAFSARRTNGGASPQRAAGTGRSPLRLLRERRDGALKLRGGAQGGPEGVWL